jgi:hypothetical protein
MKKKQKRKPTAFGLEGHTVPHKGAKELLAEAVWLILNDPNVHLLNSETGTELDQPDQESWENHPTRPHNSHDSCIGK